MRRSSCIALHRCSKSLPLGGLGEFGMNMLALTWGETTIVVDAGVMFPDPELLGVDRIIPDLTYLQQKGRVAALVLTHGHEDHIGGVPHVLPLVDGPIYGTPLTLALVEPKLEEHGIDGATGSCRCGRASACTVGPFDDRVHPRHAQHARLRGAGHPHAGRASSSTPATSRSIRRRSTASTSTCTASRELGADGRAGAVCRQHQHRSPRLHRLGARSRRRLRGDLHAARSGKLIVAAFASSIYRMQILVDLAAQFDRKVAFVGRGMMRELARSRSGSATCAFPPGVQIRDSDVGSYPRAGRAVPGDRIAGRADVGAVAHRDRRSPPRQARSRRHRRALGARDSRQREGDRPGDEPPRPPRRRRHLRGHQARPRVGARQRGGAEADALAGAAALLRPGPRRVPPAVAARAHRRARVRGTRSEAGDPARPRTATSCVRRRRRAASPARRRSAAC